MEFIKHLFIPKQKTSQQMEAEVQAEMATQLYWAKNELLQAMMKVEHYTALARAAQQTISRLEATNGTAK